MSNNPVNGINAGLIIFNHFFKTTFLQLTTPIILTMPTISVHNPANGELLTTLPMDTPSTVADKYARARAAQTSWANTSLATRKACILAFRESVLRELEELALIMTRETGKPIALSRNELNGLIPRLDFFLSEIESAMKSAIVFAEAGMTEKIETQALGVIANISAWNYPWFVGCNVLIPALLAGNTVLYKPSEYASLTGLAIIRLLHQAGVPSDVLIGVIGTGAVGQSLLEQAIDGVFFTGSHATGVRIAQTVAPRLIKLQLELGGKDPTYVCEDARVHIAAQSLADGAMYNTGQSCCSVERIYVHEKIYADFVTAFAATVKSFRKGPPENSDTYIGAITRAQHLPVLQAQVADALAKGARLVEGTGQAIDAVGNWFSPTVLADVNHTMELMREESFGPVIGIQKVGGDEEAITLMNDTRYGLTAGVFTPDEARAKKILTQIRSGTVYWNCCDRVSPRLPWSGYGDSGIGLTLSVEGIRTFTRPKAWHLRQE